MHPETIILNEDAGTQGENAKARPLRADAQRSEEAILAAALAVFASSGVDAPVREIADKAGVGVGTLYRRFPKRSDLITGVFRQQVDACTAAAATFSRDYDPGDALAKWAQRYAEFITTKRGLATALHSGDPAFAALPGYFEKQLIPAVQMLLNCATKAGEVRANDVQAFDLLRAIGGLCMAAQGDSTDIAQRMVSVLIDGLRYRTKSADA